MIENNKDQEKSQPEEINFGGQKKLALFTIWLSLFHFLEDAKSYSNSRMKYTIPKFDLGLLSSVDDWSFQEQQQDQLAKKFLK